MLPLRSGEEVKAGHQKLPLLQFAFLANRAKQHAMGITEKRDASLFKKTALCQAERCFSQHQLFSGFIVGNSSTSRMESLLVSSITKRSTPNPRPPVGGMPYSRALMKS